MSGLARRFSSNYEYPAYSSDELGEPDPEAEQQAAIERGKSLVDDWIELKQLGKRAERYC